MLTESRSVLVPRVRRYTTQPRYFYGDVCSHGHRLAMRAFIVSTIDRHFHDSRRSCNATLYSYISIATRYRGIYRGIYRARTLRYLHVCMHMPAHERVYYCMLLPCRVEGGEAFSCWPRLGAAPRDHSTECSTRARRSH